MFCATVSIPWNILIFNTSNRMWAYFKIFIDILLVSQNTITVDLNNGMNELCEIQT